MMIVKRHPRATLHVRMTFDLKAQIEEVAERDQISATQAVVNLVTLGLKADARKHPQR
jgi:hypothetical protein